MTGPSNISAPDDLVFAPDTGPVRASPVRGARPNTVYGAGSTPTDAVRDLSRLVRDAPGAAQTVRLADPYGFAEVFARALAQSRPLVRVLRPHRAVGFRPVTVTLADRAPTGSSVVILGGLGGVGRATARALILGGTPVHLVDARTPADLYTEGQAEVEAWIASGLVTYGRVQSRCAGTVRAPFAPTALIVAAGSLKLGSILDSPPDLFVDRAVEPARQLRLWVRTHAQSLRAVTVIGSSETRAPHPGFGPYAFKHAVTRAEAEALAGRYPEISFDVLECCLWSGVGMAASSAPTAAAAGFAAIDPVWGTHVLLGALHNAAGFRVRVLGGRPSRRPGAVAAISGVAGSVQPAGALVSADEFARLLRRVRPTTTRPGPTISPDVSASAIDRAVVITRHGPRTGPSFSQIWASQEGEASGG